MIFLYFCILCICCYAQTPFEFECPVSSMPNTIGVPSIDTNDMLFWKKKFSDGLHKPSIIRYREIEFDHMGISMPQWASSSEWLSIQVKTSILKIPYQLHLLYFPKNSKSVYQRCIVQDQNQKSTFYNLRWARKKEIATEFCAISSGFKLYWGKATPGSAIVFPILQESHITQANWFHLNQIDYLSYLQGGQIYIGELGTNTPRQFEKVWEVPLASHDIRSISYFQSQICGNSVVMLICGFSSQGERLYFVQLGNDMKTPEKVEVVAEGTFKLPEWNRFGNRALVYKIRRVSSGDDAQELYLYLYTAGGSGDVLQRSPTIPNREKEPEHDYLGPLWTETSIDKEPVEGIGHFFKQSDSPQHYAFIYFPIQKKQLGYQVAKLDIGTFPVAFGRGRHIAFAGENSHLVAWTFFSAAKQKNMLYLGLVNFISE